MTDMFPQNEAILRFGLENQAFFAASALDGGATLVALVKFPAVYEVPNRRLGETEQSICLFVNWDTVPLHKLQQVFGKDPPLPLKGQPVTREPLAFQPSFDCVVGALADAGNVACGKDIFGLHGLPFKLRV